MTNVSLLRVFTDTRNHFGDLASVVLDEGRELDAAHRQAMARQLGTGETAFINDLATGNISIIHPDGEIGFAGVAVLAAAWLVGHLRGEPADLLQGRDGSIVTWQDTRLTWARGELSTLPPWQFEQLKTPAAVERLTPAQASDQPHTLVWAWADQAKGLIRARTFAADWGIAEAQGNGSGAMALAAQLQRPLEILHGQGSVIHAKPAPDRHADIGGRIILVSKPA